MSNSAIARTGRVQNWLDDPTGRLPVSCTVFSVENEMEGPNGIEASWRFVSHALRNGAGVAVHLSKLDSKGHERPSGVVASGAVSFGKIYSVLNETLRRGGRFKNGAVVLHCDIDHGDILEFINVSRSEIPWAKRCVNVSRKLWDEASDEVKQAVLLGIAKGDIWLAKIRQDKYGNRIFANVCLEVFIKSRGTCLLEHINLGACKPDQIAQAFADGMEELCVLHNKTGVESTGEYLVQEEDRQVGLGMLGLANLLALEHVSYAQFADALELHNGFEGELQVTPEALNIVKELQKGIDAATVRAKRANMDRAFAIAPTASCSYRYTDRAGYTTAPEIAPPIGRKVDRDSSTFGVSQFNYGNVETAEDVGWNIYFRVANGIMEMLQKTGLCHGYSFNSWSDVVTYDESFIDTWLNSPQTSLYYSLQVMQNTQAKDNAMAALNEDYDFTFAESSEEQTSVDEYLDQFNDPSNCVGCAE